MKVILRILGFTKKFWLLLLLSFLFMVIGTAFGLVIPRMLGEGIDTVLGMGQRSFVVIAAVVIVAASALRGVANYGQRYYNEVVAQKTCYQIRNSLYERLQRLSFAFHDRSQTGQLMSRATVDVEAVRMFLALGLLGMATVILMIIAVAVLLVLMNWQLALITLFFVIPVTWLAISFGNRIRPIWLKVQAIMGFMGTTLEESLSGISVVKAFSHQQEESKKFATQASELYDEQIKAARMMAFAMPTMVILFSIPTAIILWYGGRQVVAGAMTIG
ncbi:MAG: hypothetical protein A2137_05330 [Chloroflexi bacterium RBG_16_58_8]|nr:MAG: hypothetical protein A2137_05330 [Chloroflexi bacterium RBG_16_58_8]